MNDMLFYEVGQRVSWTLVHSLWQFALIAVVLGIGLRLTRGRSPHGRYLVNLFQLAMETVFFYHPAVWWVSHRMRTEREECCDEIAANMTGDRIGYAKLLVWLEESRQQPSNQTLAMSADGGSLLGRVRRLVSTPTEASGTGSVFIVASVIFVLAIGSVLAINADSSLALQPVAPDDDRLAVQVVDDVSVKMIAVMPQQATAEKAWRPNGELFEELPFLPKVTDDSPAKPIPGIDYVFKFEGLAVHQNPTYTTEGLKGWRHPSDDGFVRIETQPSAESTSTTIEVGIPDKEWGPWVSVSIDGEIIAPVDVPPRLRNAHSIMRVHDARARGDRTMLRWAYDRAERPIATFDLVAVDNDGKRLQTWGRTLWDDEDGVTRSAEVFDHPIDQIDHFEYRLRPYRYWVTFNNVSLKPGQKTNFKTSVETVPFPSTDDLGASLSPPADPKSQSLGEQVHRQLTEISKLNSALISTQSFTSYYGDPKGLIGLKDERSLDHLKETLSKRDFDKSLSTTNHTWAWDNNEVVSTERHKYVYEGESYDQTSEHTWDGKRGWRRHSNGSFGRYRTFADAFANHYFKPSQFLHLGDHRFAWVERGKEPSFFLSSTIPVEYANYQSHPAENFGGERCHVIRSIPREEQFWISQKTGRLRGCLKFINQGRFTWIHEMESTRKLAGRSFDSREEFGQWFDEALTDEQRYQLHCEFLYLHQANQHPKDLIEFSDYREVASGIEMPMTEWWSSWMHEGKQYKYNINQTVVREVKAAPDLQPLVDKALPKKGDTINDWRFTTFVKYVFDPEMAESEIHAMVDKAMQEQASNKKQLDRILKPLKEMVGKPAPKLDGQWITAEKLPDGHPEKPTLFHFWATWCGPCKNDIPILNKMQENGWAIVGVHAPGTETDEIKMAIDDSGIEYPVLLGSETEGVGSQSDKITGYPVNMFPCCVLVDKDGKVQAVGSLRDVLKPDR